MWLVIASLVSLVSTSVAVGTACDDSCILWRRDVPDYFFKFGLNHGDEMMPKGDGFQVANLNGLPVYRYRGNDYTDITISVNGNVVFGNSSYKWWAPWWKGRGQNHEVDMMAIFWAFTNNESGRSKVFYRRSAAKRDRIQFRRAVRDASGVGFLPAEVVIVTWFNVGQEFQKCSRNKPRKIEEDGEEEEEEDENDGELLSPDDKQSAEEVSGNQAQAQDAGIGVQPKRSYGPNTYQMAIGTRADYPDKGNINTFVIFNYAKICWTYNGRCMIGFHEKEFGARYAFRGSYRVSGCADVMNHGNPLKGQYVFRVDPRNPAPDGPTCDCRTPNSWFINDFDHNKTDFEYEVC